MNKDVELFMLSPVCQEWLISTLENQREFSPEIISRNEKHHKGELKPDGDLSFDLVFSAKPIDKYGRSYYEIKRDAFFGVADYQLEQRYGRVRHEVVSHNESDFVDKFDKELCKLLSKWFDFD